MDPFLTGKGFFRGVNVRWLGKQLSVVFECLDGMASDLGVYVFLEAGVGGAGWK